MKFFHFNFKVECAKIRFLTSGFFFVHTPYFDIDFVFFFIFWSDFSGNGFLNSLIVRSRSRSRLDFSCFVVFTSSKKNLSLYLSSQLVQHFAWNLFDFARLVSLFSHSAKSVFNCSWTKFIAIIVNVWAFLMQIFRWTILLEHSLTAQLTFLRFRSSFLSDLYCSLRSKACC